MDIYIYSDESGVFDKEHNKIFVFGGIMLLSKDENDNCSRKYSSIENIIRSSEHTTGEVKATTISNKSKGKLFRSLNNVNKFGVVIEQNKVLDRIYTSKKHKQRYLDYAYKIAVKRKFQQLIKDNVIVPNQIENLYFYVDEHSTATNGIYELREGLEQELKSGTYNATYDCAYAPIFPNIYSVNLCYCNSKKKILVRAADIVANRIYYLANNNMEIPCTNNNISLICHEN